MHKFTRAQIERLAEIYSRKTREISYREFRKTAFLSFGDCMMVSESGMIIGIETDGYAHT